MMNVTDDEIDAIRIKESECCDVEDITTLIDAVDQRTIDRRELSLIRSLLEYYLRGVDADTQKSSEWNRGYRTRQSEEWSIGTNKRKLEAAEAEIERLRAVVKDANYRSLPRPQEDLAKNIR